MPEVRLFIATSLDGFIADRDGGVDRLFADGDYGYSAFFDSIEALIMGRRTYEQVLGFGEWPCGEKPTSVFTRGAPAATTRTSSSSRATRARSWKTCAVALRGTSGSSAGPRSSPRSASST